MSCKSCIVWTIVNMIFLFIVVGLPILIYFAVVKPKGPTFTLEHASVTGFNLTSDNHLTSFFNVVIRANNPNHKLKLKYSRVRVEIFKNKQKLAWDGLSKFTQRKKNVTLLRSEVVALNVILKESPAFDFRFENGVGYFDFDVLMTATLNGNYLEVHCDHAIVSTNDQVTSPVDNTEENFRSVKCSVSIYSNNY